SDIGATPGIVWIDLWLNGIPPESNWFKLNFDGASKGNPGTAARGGVIQDHK
ncbi:hypothetical protein KI387_011490, partial [Taxus chinensis]